MMKSMVLALCVLGMTQALVLPIENRDTTGMESLEIKNWLKTSIQVGELVETFKHRIGGDLEHWIVNHRQLAIQNAQDIHQLFSSDLWSELGDGAGKSIYQLLEALYSEFDHTKYERARRATEEGLEELEEIEKALKEAEDKDSLKKAEKIKSLLKNLEKGSGVMRKAVENEDVKKIYHYVCEAAGSLSKKPAKFSETDVMKSNTKSLKEKICSEKTFDQIKNVLTKGHKFFTKVNEVLHEEHITTAVGVAKKFKNWFKKKF